VRIVSDNPDPGARRAAHDQLKSRRLVDSKHMDPVAQPFGRRRLRRISSLSLASVPRTPYPDRRKPVRMGCDPQGAGWIEGDAADTAPSRVRQLAGPGRRSRVDARHRWRPTASSAASCADMAQLGLLKIEALTVEDAQGRGCAEQTRAASEGAAHRPWVSS
jgi:hypothetical protein